MVKGITKFLRHDKRKYSQNFIYALFVFFAITITYEYGFSPKRSGSTESPQAKGGVLHITQNDIENIELFQLSGEFSFYWNKLYNLNDIDTIKVRPIYVEVPSVWNNRSIYPEKITPQGFGTYHLTIHVPNEAMYAMKIKEIDCAYNLMVNGESIQVGSVGTSKETTVPSWKREEIFFYAKDKRVDIVLQIANFHHRKGGPEDVILFGPADNIRTYKMTQLILSVFLLGIFFALAGYFFHIYMVGRRESSIILFGLLSFFALLRLITTGEKILLEVLPNISWEFAIRIEYLSFVVTTGLFFSFLKTFYPLIFTKGLEKGVWTIITISILPVIFMPPIIFSHIPIYYQVFALLVGCYMICGISLALIRGLKFAGIFFVGIIFFYASLVNDVLYFNKMIQSGFLLPYGIFLLYFSFSFVMAKKLTNSFLAVDKLSSALKKQTKYLEQEVKHRTKEIIRQKDSIEHQAARLELKNKKLIELNSFRDDMTGMIIHDLKNPLNSIINLALMNDIPEKDKLIWQAGIEMHNMVLNILSVNKAEEVGFTINKQHYNFNNILTKAIHDVNVSISLKGLRIERDESAQFNLLGDAEIVKRVLVNILINAIRFSPSNGTIKITLHQHGHDSILCSIRDQGPGIKREMHHKIFDRYRSVDQTDQSLRSTGLGLAFCKMAIEAHEGTIGVSSKWGEGAEFEITLPLEYVSTEKKGEYTAKETQVFHLDNISTKSKMRIQPYLIELREKEVFEVTDITNILKKINTLSLQESDFIVSSINDALLSCNQEKYSEIINKLTI